MGTLTLESQCCYPQITRRSAVLCAALHCIAFTHAMVHMHQHVRTLRANQTSDAVM